MSALIAVVSTSPPPADQPVFPLARWRAYEIDGQCHLVGRHDDTGRYRGSTAIRAFHVDCLSAESSSGRLYRFMTGPCTLTALDLAMAIALLGEPAPDITQSVLKIFHLGDEQEAHHNVVRRLLQMHEPPCGR